MKRLVAWFAHNPVTVNLITLFVLAAGVLGATGLRREIFPALQLSRVDVTVLYPGAGPSEVEEGVLTRLEAAVADVSAASRIRSFAYEGRGVLQLELQAGRSLPATMAEIKARIDAINTLPAEAERPLVYLPVPSWPVINIGLSGPVDEPTLIHWARKIRDDATA